MIMDPVASTGSLHSPQAIGAQFTGGRGHMPSKAGAVASLYGDILRHVAFNYENTGT